jgi:hypothetical protein
MTAWVGRRGPDCEVVVANAGIDAVWHCTSSVGAYQCPGHGSSFASLDPAITEWNSEVVSDDGRLALLDDPVPAQSATETEPVPTTEEERAWIACIESWNLWIVEAANYESRIAAQRATSAAVHPVRNPPGSCQIELFKNGSAEAVVFQGLAGLGEASDAWQFGGVDPEADPSIANVVANSDGTLAPPAANRDGRPGSR